MTDQLRRMRSRQRLRQAVLSGRPTSQLTLVQGTATAVAGSTATVTMADGTVIEDIPAAGHVTLATGNQVWMIGNRPDLWIIAAQTATPVSQEFNARAYGTDPAGWQQAIDDAATSGGGNVRFPGGPDTVYDLADAQLELASGVYIVGNATLRKSGPGRAILAQNVSNCGIDGPTLDLNKAATGDQEDNNNQQGVYVLNSGAADQSNITVRCRIINGWRRGVAVVQTGSGDLTSVTIDVEVDNLGERAVHVTGTDNGAHLSKINIQARGQNIGSSGVVVSGCAQATIHDCNLDMAGSSASGIVIGAAGTGKAAPNAIVTHNRVRNVGAGLWGIVSTVGNTRFAITDNELTSCGGGITCDPDDGTGSKIDVRGLISINRVYGTTSTNGINVRVSKHVTVTGNIVDGADLSGIAISTSDDCTVSANIVTGSGTHGIFLGESAPSGGHMVSANKVSGSGVDNYSVSTTTPCDFTTTTNNPPA
jgi:parallel beta-helix repeat protein